MLHAIELRSEDRIEKERCSKAIANAESIFEKNLISDEEIICNICSQLIQMRFRSACRYIKNNQLFLIHPVHVGCIEDNVPMDKLFVDEKEFFDISSLDVLTLSSIINHLKDLEKDGKLPPLRKEFELKDLPTPDTIGEPFYTMVEKKNGTLTGNIESHIHENEKMMMLYVSRKVANEAKQIRNKEGWKDYHVAGINRKTIQKLFSSKMKFMVVIEFEGKIAKSVVMDGKEILEKMEPGGWLYKIIQLQKESGVVAKTINEGDDCLLSLGIVKNDYILLPLFYVQYPDEETLKQKLANEITFSTLSELIKSENVEGSTLEGIHTLKGDAPYTNFPYVHNAQMVIERTDDGVIIRTDFIPTEKPEGGFTTPFAFAGMIDYGPNVEEFKNLFEDIGVAVIRFDSPERAGDHLYLVCNNCLFINL